MLCQRLSHKVEELAPMEIRCAKIPVFPLVIPAAQVVAVAHQDTSAIQVVVAQMARPAAVPSVAVWQDR